VGLLSIVIRLIYLTISQGDFLQNQSAIRVLRTLEIPAHRGIIYDRNGEKLAVSLPMTAVWVDPSVFRPSNDQLGCLSQLIDSSPHIIRKRISKFSHKRFLYLKRGLDLKINDQVKSMNIAGLFTQIEYRRYYPHAETMSQILGLTNIDDKGQEGLELAYNHWLEGKSGIKKVLQNRLGHVIAKPKLLRPSRPGRNLTLSLDQRIQHQAFKALAAGVRKYHAKSGIAIVLQPKTGEILGMANYPSYNPNKPISKLEDRHRNHAVTDVFEPGSTLKPFIMASVLESGQFSPDSSIDTHPGKLWLGNYLVQDKKDYGVINLQKILQVSSNIGMAKLILSLPPASFLLLLKQFGFGQLTQSGFPGERDGFLPNFNLCNPFMLATLSFGYSLSVTALQLAQAYAILANGGQHIPITFLKQETTPIGRTVLDNQINQHLLTMLESVLRQGGTASLARIKGYRVTGKTGTTRVVGEHGYDKNRHNSIFVGIAPASQPHLVVLVMLHDLSSNQYYAGSTAGVVFSKIMTHALSLLNIPPDNP
jgi:cell division protein FtsI (penicillin-binding protein 3)